jgi:hypothetical protein
VIYRLLLAICLLLTASLSVAIPIPSTAAAPELARAQDAAGTYEGDGIVLTFTKAAAGYAGTVKVEGQSYPCTLTISDGKVKGSFTADGEAFGFTGTLEGDTMTVTSEGVTHALKKKSAGGVNPLAKKPGEPTGGGWKILKHPAGLSIQYPNTWQIKQTDEAYQLITEDQSEIILIGGVDAQGITNPSDPRLVAGADELVATQVSPALKRVGSASPAKDAAGKGVTLIYEGDLNGQKTRVRMYTTILKGQALGVTMIGSVEKVKAREAILAKMFATLREFKPELDTRLVGNWHRFSESIIDAQSSGGRKAGDASSVSNRSVNAQLGGDGKLVYRVTGKGMASGAGQFVEYDINETSKGTWMASDGKFLIIWEDGSTDEYTYTLSANGLVLRGGGKEIVYRKR